MAKLGGSLLVPCVQDLAKKPMETVPPRYIRPEQEFPIISDGGLISEIPVINMQKLFTEELEDSELVKLHFACKEWGFFQENLKDLDKPLLYLREQKLDWGDMFYMTTQPVHLRKPHLFPNLPLPLRETLEVYSLELRTLAISLLLKVAKVLNIKADEMRDFFENGKQSMRMNYYPPCPQPEKVMGLTPHSDATGLTILLQINEVEGLQIKKNGKWVPVSPLPNAFIVNIGDMLEMITNGTYRSIEHRATVNSVQERLSIATFYSPRYDGEVGPAFSLITEQTPASFRRVTIEEYFKGLFARELHEKSYLDSMRIKHGRQG
ncbi:hypothetical protein Patl1_04963 [Pistacia atlantica]|uniref:Uncharacterized protein n=1 Tax=Pistacia atlantica TaxID=434234 RepID=A0ACC1BS70_9ROSI|nr:hypothetical protein Patl1_04963 [Pistacia atlantica]